MIYRKFLNVLVINRKRRNTIKKHFLILIVILVFVLSSCQKTDNIEIGMTYSEAESIKPNCIIYCGYMFYKENNINVVCRFNGETIEEIMEFPIVKPSSEAFSAISTGMTVAEVVKTVGIPAGDSQTFGLCTLDFNCVDGSVYRIVWDGDMKVIEITKL